MELARDSEVIGNNLELTGCVVLLTETLSDDDSGLVAREEVISLLNDPEAICDACDDNVGLKFRTPELM